MKLKFTLKELNTTWPIDGINRIPLVWTGKDKPSNIFHNLVYTDKELSFQVDSPTSFSRWKVYKLKKL